MRKLLQIRRAQAGDASSLVCLIGDGDVVRLARRFRNRSNRDREVVLVAVREAQQPVAAIHLCRCSRLDGRDFARVELLVVRPEYRRDGLVRRLIQAAEEWSAAVGLHELHFETRIEQSHTRTFLDLQGFAGGPVTVTHRKPVGQPAVAKVAPDVAVA